MMLQLREDRVDTSGAIVLRRGQRVEAKPLRRRCGVYAVKAGGRLLKVDADALEPVDDLDLPDPEPVPIAVLLREVASERGSVEDSRALPFAVVAVGVLVVLLALGVG
jgi:hypothetical protein